MNRSILFTLTVGLFIAAGLVVPLESRAQVPPSTLTNEFFIQGIPTFFAVHCDPTTRSTFSYSVSGTAIGPYPGTFTEVGRVTIGPIAPGEIIGNVESFQAAFTIDSPAGHVVGVKQGPRVPWGASCQALLESRENGTFTVTEVPDLPADYQARIQTATGIFEDQGISIVNLFDFNTIQPGTIPLSPDSFDESYQSLLQTPTPVRDKNCDDKRGPRGRCR